MGRRAQWASVSVPPTPASLQSKQEKPMMTKRNGTMEGETQESLREGPCMDLYPRGKGKGPDFFPAAYPLPTTGQNGLFRGHPEAPVRFQSLLNMWNINLCFCVHSGPHGTDKDKMCLHVCVCTGAHAWLCI